MRYFIAFAAMLGLLFLVLFLLFHGSGKPAAPVTHKALSSYSNTDAQAQLTIDGPVNDDQEHRALRITVGSNAVTFEALQGYQGNVTNTQTFGNNPDAYANFLLALAYAGFTQGNNTKAFSDERGRCPLGNRYVFSFSQDGRSIERYWATSCNGDKTYQGNLGLSLDLFEAQVPNYGQLAQAAGV